MADQINKDSANIVVASYERLAFVLCCKKVSGVMCWVNL